MCGIIGFSGHFKADPSKLRILLLDNESRGRDSTGIYGNRLMRKLGTATKFVNDVNFDHVVRSNIVLGHTRNSTTVKISKDTAHPFVFKSDDHGDIVGTHNGWLINEYEVEKKLSDINFKKGQVDSETLFKAIWATGDKMFFQVFEGPMALAFKFDGKLYLFRRKSRPLFLGRAKEGFYYSSIKESLSKIGIPKEKMYELKPNVLMEITGSKITDAISVPEERVEFSAHTSTANWSHLVKNKELLEELTGKKPQAATAAVRTNTYQGHTDTSTHKIITTSSLFQQMTSIEDMKTKKGVPTMRGNDLFLPSETKNTSLYLQLMDFFNKRRYSMPYIGCTKTGRLNEITPFWPIDSRFSTCVVNPMVLSINNRMLERSDKYSGIMFGFRMNLRFFSYFNKNGVLNPTKDENYIAIASVKKKDGKYLAYKMLRASHDLYGENRDVYMSNRILSIDGNKEEDIEVDLFLINVRCPGIVSKTNIRLKSGHDYYFDVIHNVGNMYSFRKVMHSESYDLLEELPILESLNVKKYREVYLDYRTSNLLKEGSITDSVMMVNAINDFTKKYNENMKKKYFIQL